jgi:membrane protease YdiL (CAAX protease family)
LGGSPPKTRLVSGNNWFAYCNNDPLSIRAGVFAVGGIMIVEREQHVFSVRDAVLLWLLYVGVLICLSVLLALLLLSIDKTALRAGSPWLIFDYILGTISLLVVLLVGWRKDRRILLRVAVGTLRNPSAWIVVALLPLGYVLLNRYIDTWLQGVQPLFRSEGISTRVSIDYNGVTRIAGIIFPCIIGPIFEELFFRGYLFTGLRQRYGRSRAIILTSVLFVAAHFNLNNLIAALLVAFPLGIIYAKTNNLLFPITLHALCSIYARVYPNTGAGRASITSGQLVYAAIAATALLLGFILLVRLRQAMPEGSASGGSSYSVDPARLPEPEAVDSPRRQ